MASDRKIELEIMTPLKSIFKGEADSLIACGVDGYFGVLVDHAPMLAAMSFGPLYVKTGGEARWFVVCDGFFEIHANRAVLLVDTCEAKDQIDLDRARTAKERAEQRLAARTEEIDIARAQAALQRALIRLQVASK